jgi:hypothetical protein
MLGPATPRPAPPPRCAASPRGRSSAQPAPQPRPHANSRKPLRRLRWGSYEGGAGGLAARARGRGPLSTRRSPSRLEVPLGRSTRTGRPVAATAPRCYRSSVSLRYARRVEPHEGGSTGAGEPVRAAPVQSYLRLLLLLRRCCRCRAAQQRAPHSSRCLARWLAGEGPRLPAGSRVAEGSRGGAPVARRRAESAQDRACGRARRGLTRRPGSPVARRLASENADSYRRRWRADRSAPVPAPEAWRSEFGARAVS